MSENQMINIEKELMQIDAENGLPENVFRGISSVCPIANVDLLILDEDNRILLSWRDDEYFGKGWHIPGGCIRFKETMLERVYKTAEIEIKANIEVKQEPIAVRDVILGKKGEEPRLRVHHLAVLFECHISEFDSVKTYDGTNICAGDLQWFKKVPGNILSVHSVYNDIFEKYGLM